MRKASMFEDLRCPYKNDYGQRCVLNDGHEGHCVFSELNPGRKVFKRPPIDNVDDFIKDCLRGDD